MLSPKLVFCHIFKLWECTDDTCRWCVSACIFPLYLHRSALIHQAFITQFNMIRLLSDTDCSWHFIIAPCDMQLTCKLLSHSVYGVGVSYTMYYRVLSTVSLNYHQRTTPCILVFNGASCLKHAQMYFRLIVKFYRKLFFFSTSVFWDLRVQLCEISLHLISSVPRADCSRFS